MAPETQAPSSAERICKILAADGLISPLQARTILARMGAMREALGKRQAEAAKNRKGPVRSAVRTPITPVDVVVSLHLDRADDPSRKLDEDTVYQSLARAWNFPFKKIDPLKLDLNLVTTTIPRSFALKHLILPIAVENRHLTVATPNPFDIQAMDDISRVTSLGIRPVVSPKSQIIKLIDEFFGFKRSIAEAEHQFAGPSVDLGNLEQYVRMRASDEMASNDQHIVNAVNYLFRYAFDQRASDIHIEPKRTVTLVRMRIDGVLHTVYKLPKNVHPAMISRIKNLSRLDMTERRRPQDGRIKTNKGDQAVEMRVSIIPTAFGEKVVLRIMDPDIFFQELDKLGFTSTDLIRYNQIIKMPHGIVLVCGPTGSGKSTTLYSTLRDLSSPEINITTIEDPIEMVHEDFNQIAVQRSVGVTFGSILRNILRQDPDIIMVGEMRDLETAENAVQAALTGHLVLSTLHTNDAPAAITRLVDLGVPAFLIQSTLVGILAQRLVRCICPYCIEPLDMEASELLSLGIDVGRKGTVGLHRGKGCHNCRGTGYFGRLAVYEVVPYSEPLKRLTRPDADLESIRAAARSEGMVTMRENAIGKLLAGVTTYQEVLRVTWEQG